MKAVSTDSTSEAIHALLSSATFRRADSLRVLLQYLYDQHLAGRSHEVSEYEVATQVLGRETDFSPTIDSSVRTRILSLRKKLDEFYQDEGRNTEMRVEIPRGTYGLRFRDCTINQEPLSEHAKSRDESAPVIERQSHPSRLGTWLGVVGGMGGAVLLMALWAGFQSYESRAADRNLRQAWGSMLDQNSNVILVVGTPASFFVRDFGDNLPPVDDPKLSFEPPRTAQFENWYQSTGSHPLGKNVILHPSMHSPLWGDAAAAVVVSEMLSSRGVRAEMVPSGRIHPVALRDRNVVLIGRSEYNQDLNLMLPDHGLAIDYNPSLRRLGVQNRRPAHGEPEWWFCSASRRQNYGLVSVLSNGDDSQTRTIIFSGVNSDGAEAGARFLTTDYGLRQLEQEMKKEGYTRWPARFQVVVRTDSIEAYTVRSSLSFLRVLDR